MLAIPGFYLARELWRTVPEPLRGGHSHLEAGAADLEVEATKAQARADRGEATAPERAPTDADSAEHEVARDAARRAGAVPDPRLVLREDASRMGPNGPSASCLISVHTLLVAGSSLGYFYFAGLQTFALLFVKGHFHASQLTAELVLALLVVGAVVGTLVGGRLPDWLLRRATSLHECAFQVSATSALRYCSSQRS